MSKSKIGSFLIGYTVGTVFVVAHMAMQGVRAHREQRLLPR